MSRLAGTRGLVADHGPTDRDLAILDLEAAAHLCDVKNSEGSHASSDSEVTRITPSLSVVNSSTFAELRSKSVRRSSCRSPSTSWARARHAAVHLVLVAGEISGHLDRSVSAPWRISRVALSSFDAPAAGTARAATVARRCPGTSAPRRAATRATARTCTAP